MFTTLVKSTTMIILKIWYYLAHSLDTKDCTSVTKFHSDYIVVCNGRHPVLNDNMITLVLVLGSTYLHIQDLQYHYMYSHTYNYVHGTDYTINNAQYLSICYPVFYKLFI